MNIVMLGAPGSGKGTQSTHIIENHNFMHVSTGDLLRAEIAAGTDIGNRVKKLMDQGKLVDQQIIVDIVKKTIENNATKRLLFDGFPRTFGQAELLTELLEKEGAKVNIVFFMEISEDAVVKRLVNRYSCVACGAIYNSLLKPLTDSTECDHCKCNSFKQRPDDKEDVIRERFEIYKTEVSDIVDYYKKFMGVLVTIDAEQPETVIKDIIDRNIREHVGRI
jgi:adenylate kinase